MDRSTNSWIAAGAGSGPNIGRVVPEGDVEVRAPGGPTSREQNLPGGKDPWIVADAAYGPQGPTSPLVGRERELRVLDAFLTGPNPRGPILVLRGDPGMGKTMLLRAAAARAEAAGTRALRASGVEFEREFAFSGLHQLLRPLQRHLGCLEPVERNVLAQVLGLAEAARPSRLAISSATLALLDAAAVHSALLLVVDDIHWMDRSSAEILGFVARRLDQRRILVLAATRSGHESPFDQARFPECALEPLDGDSARRLLEDRYPHLAPSVQQSLLTDAAGNPLALLELASSLSDRQLTGLDELPASLPVSHRLRMLFAGRVSTLPSAAAHVLLLAALEGSGDLVIVEAAAGDSWDQAGLAAAEAADLIRVGDNNLSFRHPLIRSAIVQMSSPSARRDAHRALAGCLVRDPERQAWHLAGGSVEPDEAVAQALEEAARRAAGRGGATVAITALVRAAELSPDPADRARRLTEAAYTANHTAQFDRAASLLDKAQRACGNPRDFARAAGTATAYLQLHHEGDIDAAHRLLLWLLQDDDAIPSDGVKSDRATNEALYTMLFACFSGGREVLWDAYDEVLLRHADEASDDLAFYGDAFAAAQADSVRARLREQLATLPEDGDFWRLPRLGLAAVQIDALDECRPRLRRTVERERDGGAVAPQLACLILLSIEARLAGRWDESQALAGQGAEIAEASRYPLYSCILRCQSMLVAANRGQTRTTQQLAWELTAWAGPRRVGLAMAAVLQARTILALGEDSYEEAYTHASRVTPPGVLSPRIHYTAGMVMDLVEAAVRTGRMAEARAHVAAAQQAQIAGISSRLDLLTSGAAALAADDEETGSIFADALAKPGASRWPFERARVELYYGCWLRRSRDLTGSRAHLRSALKTFTSLGAVSWAARAERELRATGVSLTRSPDGRAVLTPQEWQIATLAASGMTNKQIGERLSLSPRTVGSHLYRLFPKLGIASRSAVRRALEGVTDPGQEADR
ncbi:helix-turn-helix transcriptional regulator [Streptomyces sp. NBC_00271]|uniref:helix-turn-helix transcriptional regulator n=1 Tax=Streptomyces sp. NBC_00271 TaxID=2975697 RepID=UPI002E2B957A|nr:LuxR family transcriptional regulator [Streptomyces sp. NBC_00271]